MLKTDKERVIAELAERLRASDTLLVADYRGLTMSQIDGLRGELIKHGARFSVVKNTLTRRAAEEAGVPELLALLDGPTAIAFIETGGDLVAVAKALDATARDTKVLTVRGGVLDGTRDRGRGRQEPRHPAADRRAPRPAARGDRGAAHGDRRAAGRAAARPRRPDRRPHRGLRWRAIL